jgi:hypothetical protein
MWLALIRTPTVAQKQYSWRLLPASCKTTASPKLADHLPNWRVQKRASVTSRVVVPGKQRHQNEVVAYHVSSWLS